MVLLLTESTGTLEYFLDYIIQGNQLIWVTDTEEFAVAKDFYGEDQIEGVILEKESLPETGVPSGMLGHDHQLRSKSVTCARRNILLVAKGLACEPCN